MYTLNNFISFIETDKIVKIINSQGVCTHIIKHYSCTLTVQNSNLIINQGDGSKQIILSFLSKNEAMLAHGKLRDVLNKIEENNKPKEPDNNLIFVDTFSDLPNPGLVDTIYIEKEFNKQYVYDIINNTYVELIEEIPTNIVFTDKPTQTISGDLEVDNLMVTDSYNLTKNLTFNISENEMELNYLISLSDDDYIFRIYDDYYNNGIHEYYINIFTNQYNLISTIDLTTYNIKLNSFYANTCLISNKLYLLDNDSNMIIVDNTGSIEVINLSLPFTNFSICNVNDTHIYIFTMTTVYKFELLTRNIITENYKVSQNTLSQYSNNINYSEGFKLPYYTYYNNNFYEMSKPISPYGVLFNIDGFSDLTDLDDRIYNTFAYLFFDYDTISESYTFSDFTKVIGKEIIFKDTITNEKFAMVFSDYNGINSYKYTRWTIVDDIMINPVVYDFTVPGYPFDEVNSNITFFLNDNDPEVVNLLPLTNYQTNNNSFGNYTQVFTNHILIRKLDNNLIHLDTLMIRSHDSGNISDYSGGGINVLKNNMEIINNKLFINTQLGNNYTTDKIKYVNLSNFKYDTIDINTLFGINYSANVSVSNGKLIITGKNSDNNKLYILDVSNLTIDTLTFLNISDNGCYNTTYYNNSGFELFLMDSYSYNALPTIINANINKDKKFKIIANDITNNKLDNLLDNVYKLPINSGNLALENKLKNIAIIDSKYGNNTTGEIDNLDKSFSDLTPTILNNTNNDTIIINDSFFTDFIFYTNKTYIFLKETNIITANLSDTDGNINIIGNLTIFTLYCKSKNQNINAVNTNINTLLTTPDMINIFRVKNINRINNNYSGVTNNIILEIYCDKIGQMFFFGENIKTTIYCEKYDAVSSTSILNIINNLTIINNIKIYANSSTLELNNSDYLFVVRGNINLDIIVNTELKIIGGVSSFRLKNNNNINITSKIIKFIVFSYNVNGPALFIFSDAINFNVTYTINCDEFIILDPNGIYNTQAYKHPYTSLFLNNTAETKIILNCKKIINNTSVMLYKSFNYNSNMSSFEINDSQIETKTQLIQLYSLSKININNCTITTNTTDLEFLNDSGYNITGFPVIGAGNYSGSLGGYGAFGGDNYYINIKNSTFIRKGGNRTETYDSAFITTQGSNSKLILDNCVFKVDDNIINYYTIRGEGVDVKYNGFINSNREISNITNINNNHNYLGDLPSVINNTDVISIYVKTADGQLKELSISDLKTEELTYDEIYTRMLTNKLNTGCFYLMTDFATVYDQPDYLDASTPKTTVVTKTALVDPIFLLATSPNTFAKEVWRPSTPQHRLEYDINFSQTEVMGAPAKGRITYCKDEFDNETHYDHTVVLLKRYESVSGSGIYNSYRDTGFTSVEVPTFGTNSKSNKIGISTESVFFIGNNTFGNNAYSNTLGDETINNVFGNSFKYNKFGSYITFCIFGDYASSNTFGNYIVGCIFGGDAKNNIFGNHINSMNFTLATHVYQSYYCEILRRADGNARLMYMNNSDVMIVVDPTT